MGSALPPKASGKPAQKEKKKGLPKLPPHLAAKVNLLPGARGSLWLTTLPFTQVKNPNYDMDQDTSLTDEEIALLEKWKVRPDHRRASVTDAHVPQPRNNVCVVLPGGKVSLEFGGEKSKAQEEASARGCGRSL